MRTMNRFLPYLLLLLLPACYAAKVETGLPASKTQIRQTFASSWIYGLVPPKTVAAAAQCPNGVAVVETQLSFVNQLVGFLTLGIYTPMQIVVTCAEKPAVSLMRVEVNLALAEGATEQEAQEVFARAADEAVRTGRPVCVWTTSRAAEDISQGTSTSTN